MSTIHRQRTYIINNWGILCGTFGVNHIWKKIGENKGEGGGGENFGWHHGRKDSYGERHFWRGGSNPGGHHLW